MVSYFKSNNNNQFFLLSAYFVPGTMFMVLHDYLDWALQQPCEDKCYYSWFIDEEVRLQSIK